jgi:hypothetical protein
MSRKKRVFKKGCAKVSNILSRLRLSFVLEKEAYPLVLLFLLTAISGDPYIDQWFFVGMGLSVWFFIWAVGKFRLSLVFLVTYILMNTFFQVWSMKPWAYKEWILLDATILRWSFLALLAFVVATTVRVDKVFRIVPLLVVFGCIATILDYPVIRGNSSQNAALLACLLPLCSWYIWLLVSLVVFLQNGSTPYLVLGLEFFISMVWIWRWRWQYIILSCGVGVVVCFFWFSPSMYVDRIRFEYYEMIVPFWWEWVNPFIGSGWFSFETLSMVMQKLTGYYLDKRQGWLSVHSDFLQMLMELGVIGFSLSMWVLFDSLYHSNWKLRGAIAGIAAWALFYFPLRFPVILFISIIYAVNALKLEKD